MRDLMTRDHEHLANLFVEVALACGAGNQDEACRMWRAFSVKLNRHLGLEERVIFPAFKRAHSVDMRVLVAQHQQIRRRAVEVTDALDRQQLRLETLRGFIATLRAHAKSEDELMYTWADAQHSAATLKKEATRQRRG